VILTTLFSVILATLSLSGTNTPSSVPPGKLSPYAAIPRIPHTISEHQYASGSSSIATNAPLFYSTLLKESRIPALFASQATVSPGTLSPYAAIARIPHTILEYQYASGSLLGSRDFLTEHGIEPSITYTSDSAGNPVGGKHPGGFTYCDNIAFNLLLKTENLLGWKNGYFVISGLQRDGKSLSKENIKNIFPAQQVYGGALNYQTFHFYQLYYEQRTADEKMSIKTGRFVASDDFDSSPLYWLYMNRAIDGRPFSLSADAGLSCPPNAVWASRLKVKLPESTILRVGAYQVTNISVNGLNWNFYPDDGVMLLGQLEWDPEFFKKPKSSEEQSAFLANTHHNRSARQVPGASVPSGFIGHYWMGGYYSTHEYPQFGSKTKVSNIYGLYWHGDQTIYRPNRASNEGAAIWSVLTLSPQENEALIPFQANGGAVYTGLIPGRRNDFTILGCAYGSLSTSYASVQEQKYHLNPTYELVYEAAYRINTTKYSYIQPDLQWIINPSGTGKIPNALVLGFQIGVVF
jgi:porin